MSLFYTQSILRIGLKTYYNSELNIPRWSNLFVWKIFGLEGLFVNIISFSPTIIIKGVTTTILKDKYKQNPPKIKILVVYVFYKDYYFTSFPYIFQVFTPCSKSGGVGFMDIRFIYSDSPKKKKFFSTFNTT